MDEGDKKKCGPCITEILRQSRPVSIGRLYEGWNFNSGNYLFTTDTK